eukprot:gene6138-6844_t
MHNTPPYSTDSHTRVTYKRNSGYLERVGQSCCGAFIGILIFLAGFPLLFFNEGRAVQTAKSLDEGLRSVIELPSSTIISELNNNKLVYLSGPLRTDWPLADDEYGISITAVKLQRNVEMYQWVEHESKREYNEGQHTRVETTYSYSREWKSAVVNSGAFDNTNGHHNPNSMLIKSEMKTAKPVYTGEFHLSDGLTSRINNFRTYQPKVVPQGREDEIRIVGEYFYHSKNPQYPKVGDLRISFQFAGISGDTSYGTPDRVSIIARQNGIFLSSYQTKAGDKLELLYHGEMSAKEIFDAEHQTNTMLTWFLRFIGWLLMFIGLQMITDIVRQLVSFVPILRELVSLATSLFSLALASSCALVTIAIGWFVYRPVLSLALILGAAVPIYLSRKQAERQKGEEEKKGYYS